MAKKMCSARRGKKYRWTFMKNFHILSKHGMMITGHEGSDGDAVLRLAILKFKQASTT